MSVGYEAYVIALLIHGTVAFGIGFLASLIPKRANSWASFGLFLLLLIPSYSALAWWYSATFNLQELIDETFFAYYAVTGLTDFIAGTYWLRGRRNHERTKEGVDR